MASASRLALILLTITLTCAQFSGFVSAAKPSGSTAQTLFSGATPLGSASTWSQDGAGSIVADVVILPPLDVNPTFLSRVTYRNTMNYGLDVLNTDPLANVTGTGHPRSPSPGGFKLRLRSKPAAAEEAAKPLTPTAARAGDWRVQWVAASTRHLPELKNYFPNSIPAVVALLKTLVDEEPTIVKGLMAADYQPPASRLAQLATLAKEKAAKEAKIKAQAAAAKAAAAAANATTGDDKATTTEDESASKSA